MADNQDLVIEYEVPSHQDIIAVDFLIDVKKKLGNPTRIEGETSWKLVDAILKVWGAVYPEQITQFKEEVKQELAYERPIRQSLKGGGHFMIQYPPVLYGLLKYLLPEQKLNDKKFIKKFLQRYPGFEGTNYKI